VPRLVSRPSTPLTGRFRPPGDKSITHRAYLLGLLNSGVVEVRDVNPGADCAATRVLVERLGGRIDGDRIAAPERLVEPRDVLDCGNSGTTLRLAAGILAAQPFLSVLTGDASLRERPVARIVDPLRRMGAEVRARAGDRKPPLVLRGGPLTAVHTRAEVASAQLLSCVLLAGLAAEGTTVVEIPGPARDHTERMLQAFGVPLAIEPLPHGGRRVLLEGPRRIAAGDRTLRVPGDFSAAAFFLAAAAGRDGASVTAEAVNLNPTRTALLEVLEAMGARVVRTGERTEGGEPIGEVTVTGTSNLRGFEIPPEWVPRLVDEIPAWAVAASLARGRSRVTGAAELRVKESDRLRALATNLECVGVQVRELPDGLEIEGGNPEGGAVEAAGDHRIAMAFAVLGGACSRDVVVDDGASIATSYPGFAATYRALGGSIEVAGEQAS